MCKFTTVRGPLTFSPVTQNMKILSLISQALSAAFVDPGYDHLLTAVLIRR